MTKLEFLAELRSSLTGLPQADLEERLAFYAEQIDDRIEDGMSEEEAVAAVGSVAEIVLQVVDEYPFSDLLRVCIRPKRKLSAGLIVLLALGSPVWLAVLISLFAVVFSLYVSLWAVIVSVWAVFVSLVASAIGGIAGGILFIGTGYALSGLAVIAAALVCGGLAVFAFYGCKAASKSAVWLTKKMMLGIKKSMIRKEGAQ